MKKLLFGLFLISISVQTQQSYAQNTLISEVDISKLKLPESNKIESRLNLNYKYLKAISIYNKASHIKDMEYKVSKFNVKHVKEYKGEDKPFEVKFKSDLGSILVAYDKNGQILYTTEKFKNVKLPLAIRTTVFKTFPKWGLVSTTYHVEYHKDKSMVEYYKIRISNGDDTKELKLTSEGEQI